MSAIELWPFKRSEQEQFEDLLKPHLKQLYKLAFRFTNHRDDAEDLVQDVLIKLYPRLVDMQNIEKLSPWLARILYRHFIDKLRSSNRSPVDYTDDIVTLYETHSSSQDEPNRLYEIETTQHRLHTALQKLGDEQRILVLLHDVEGYTLDEIHTIQDIPLGTLKSRLSRSRNKLREILNQVERFAETRRVY